MQEKSTICRIFGRNPIIEVESEPQLMAIVARLRTEGERLRSSEGTQQIATPNILNPGRHDVQAVDNLVEEFFVFASSDLEEMAMLCSVGLKFAEHRLFWLRLTNSHPVEV